RKLSTPPSGGVFFWQRHLRRGGIKRVELSGRLSGKMAEYDSLMTSKERKPMRLRPPPDRQCKLSGNGAGGSHGNGG
ncbi:MAG TPA: hypothetical protein VMQ73_12150, partial [Methylomirabilota bacterium]|nr:hypothetical protein [Methylomirabilota bacterium]